MYGKAFREGGAQELRRLSGLVYGRPMAKSQLGLAPVKDGHSVSNPGTWLPNSHVRGTV